jgi:uncharacterized surface protein with fasciclin (FAS1) repeats
MTDKNKINVSIMKNIIRQILLGGSKIVLFAAIMFSCDNEPQRWIIKSTQQVISEYVETNPEFSEFNKILGKTGLNNLLAVRGPFTLFLPSDAQLKAYYAEKGVGSYTDFDDEFLNQLVLNHVIGASIETGEIGLGAIREPNAIGDYVVTEFQGADIILNKYSKIIKRNILASNGVIHHIDKVLDPVTKSVFEVLTGNPSFSLFTEGLVRAGLKDTLQTITFPYGNQIARTRFTILAVADSTFNRYGITNINQLVAYFTDQPDSTTYLNNDFFRYMEYHCLANTYYLSDITSKLYPTITYDNNLSIKVEDDYKINIDKNKNYTKFVIDQSNNPGKNGTVHTVAGLLPTSEPSPTTIVWETTDHFDLKQGDYYLKNYKRWFDGQNTFANIKWEGDYLLYYFKNHDAPEQVNWDCLSMSGWWWCEVTTPKIMKGKYKISGNIWSGQIDYAMYVDGVNTALIKRTDPAQSTTWAEVEWTKTETHTFKAVATSPGLLFWDTIIFTPISN